MASHILVPLSDKQKRFLRKLNNTTQRFAIDTPKPEMKKVREYLGPVKPGFVPRVKGRTGCKLNPATRAIIEARREANQAFHRDLAAFVRGE